MQGPRLVVVTAGLALVAGCPDPKGQFNDFGNRVVDGGGGDPVDAGPCGELADVSGTFYVTLEPIIAPGSYFSIVWDNTLAGSALTIDQQILTHDTRVDTGAPTQHGPVTFANCQATLIYDDLIIPDVANPITGSELSVDLTVVLTVVDGNAICGNVTSGMTSSGIDISGSTLLAVRVPDGTRGDDLPGRTTECPSASPPDAGPIDGGN
jgi:hypothetical protein